jgi:hypothetical protein
MHIHVIHWYTFAFIHSHHSSLHSSFLIIFLSIKSLIVTASNKLKGSIPREIQYLFRLDYLDLSHNSIDGSIPHRELLSQKNLVQLEYLNLKDNQLTGPLLPPYFGMLNNHKRLRFLDLSNNNLTHDVKSIEKDNISGVASESWHNDDHLGETTLETLALGGNNNNLVYDENENEDIIATTAFIIPEQIRLLTNLRELSLNNMNLSGTIPSWIGSELRHLKSLLLHDNNFVGTVPQSIGSLPNLGKYSTR